MIERRPRIDGAEVTTARRCVLVIQPPVPPARPALSDLLARLHPDATLDVVATGPDVPCGGWQDPVVAAGILDGVARDLDDLVAAVGPAPAIADVSAVRWPFITEIKRRAAPGDVADVVFACPSKPRDEARIDRLRSKRRCPIVRWP